MATNKLVRINYDVWMRAKGACPYVGESLKAFTEGALERRLAGLAGDGVEVGGRQVVEVAWSGEDVTPVAVGAAGVVDADGSVTDGSAESAEQPPPEPAVFGDGSGAWPPVSDAVVRAIAAVTGGQMDDVVRLPDVPSVVHEPRRLGVLTSEGFTPEPVGPVVVPPKGDGELF